MGSPVKYWIACSGGVDSVVLANLLYQLKKPIGLLHCNFQLRGEESNDDELFVRELAEKLSIPIRVKHFEVKKYIERFGGNTQLVARKLRYEWFDSIIDETNSYVCLGHHQDDQIETFFLQLRRGAKVKGLSCMERKHNNYLRPLLDRSKDELIEIAQHNNWSWREDRSNQSNDYKRNLYRNKLLPFVSGSVNLPEITLKLINNFQFLNGLLDHLKLTVENEFGAREVMIVDWQQWPAIIKRSVIQRNGMGKYSVEEIDRLTKGRSGASLKGETGSVGKFGECLVFVPDELRKWSFVLKEASFIEALSENEETVDRDKIDGGYEIRPWTDQDFIRPLGMNGSKTIRKYLKDNGVPTYYRSMIPVVVDGDDQVVMIPGIGIDGRFKVSSATNKFLICTRRRH